MLSKKLHLRKKSSLKKDTARSDALISEVLEKRQMLDGTQPDDTHFDVHLMQPNGNYVTNDWTKTSEVYSAPWVTKSGQGQDQSTSWTVGNPSALTAGEFNLQEGIVHTIADFRIALEKQQVKEVSDDLIGLFVDNGTGTLYNPAIQRAWGFSSDNLYTLLVLNNRFPGTLEFINGLDGPTEYRIDSRVNQAMQRVVGFGFTGNWVKNPDGSAFYDPATTVPGQPFPNDFRTNQSGPDDFKVTMGVFSKTEVKAGASGPATFTLATANISVPFSDLNLQTPTIARFFNFTNDAANGRGNSKEDPADPDSKPVPELPVDVLKKLKDYYTGAIGTHANSVEVFADISGIKNLNNLLTYPNQINPPPNTVVYDGRGLNLSNYLSPQDLTANYLTYKDACIAVGGYYNDEVNASPKYTTTEAQVKGFFDDFAREKIKQWSDASNQTARETLINELAIGLRALMALAYDASPFWTSYGIGYSNAANPMVGKKLPKIHTPESFIDLFNGQEIQLNNIKIPGSPEFSGTAQNAYHIPVMDSPPYSDRALPSFDNYTTDGWFSLNAPQSISGIQYVSPNDADYKENYLITSHASGIVTAETSTSSDTVDASGIPLLVGAPVLSPTDTVNIPDSPTEIKDLYPFNESAHLIPSSFTTFISMAGGVDRVTGSDFTDVIVGPTNKSPHGRLTVDLGAGDDFLSPGRGGSLVQLGEGEDTVYFGVGDLFGTANFLDFQQAHDKILHHKNIKVQRISGDTILLSDRYSSATKTLRLTPTSNTGGLIGDSTWNLTSFKATSTNAGAGFQAHTIDSTDPTLADRVLDYIETHSFTDPGEANLMGFKFLVTHDVSLNASMLQDSYREGDVMAVSIGDKTVYQTFQNSSSLKPNTIGFYVPINAATAPTTENFTMSMTPLPTLYETQVVANATNGLTASDITTAKASPTEPIELEFSKYPSTPFPPHTLNPIQYLRTEGSSLYLFDATDGGQNMPCIGKVFLSEGGAPGVNAAGEGKVKLYINNNSLDQYGLPSNYSLSPNAKLAWKPANTNTKAEQVEVFVNRQNGYVDSFDSHMTADKKQIKTSSLMGYIENVKQTYNWTDLSFAQDVHRADIPFSKWMRIPGSSTQIAYVGGLAKYILENNIASSALGMTFPTLEITIDDNFEIDAGPGKYNLSSNFSLYEYGSAQPDQTLNALVDQLNNIAQDPVDQNIGWLPAPFGAGAGVTFLGTHSLSTGSQVFINGTGTINASNVNTNPNYKDGASSHDGNNSHPDWAANTYYTIGSDILTLSSTYIPNQTTPPTAYSINAHSFTSAWPLKKGIGGVRFQEWESIAKMGPNGVEIGYTVIRNADSAYHFDKSPVHLVGHKQLGGWTDQADGPQIGGWHSVMEQSFIHANDDSVKFGAPAFTAKNNTVIQGNAGAAIGTGYGYVNGGFDDGVADSIFIHRVNSNDPYRGLAMNWVSPIEEYFYQPNNVSQDTTVEQTLTVENVYVPKLQQINYDSSTGSPQPKIDFNKVLAGAGLWYAQTPHLFGFKTEKTNEFTVDIGNIEMYEGWNIGTDVSKDNFVYMGNYFDSNGDHPETIFQPTSFQGSGVNRFAQYENVKGQWQALQAENIDAVSQYNNGLTLSAARTGPTVNVQQTGPINLFSPPTLKIARPQLRQATKIRLNRGTNFIGPQPIRMMYSQIKAAVSSNLRVSNDDSYVITELASGKVEKKQGDSWVDVSTPPRSSNPFELLALLQRRIIKPTDEIRWVPDTEDQGEVSTKAFELIGWNGTTASEKETSIEIDAGGWSDI